MKNTFDLDSNEVDTILRRETHLLFARSEFYGRFKKIPVIHTRFTLTDCFKIEAIH